MPAWKSGFFPTGDYKSIKEYGDKTFKQSNDQYFTSILQK